MSRVKAEGVDEGERAGVEQEDVVLFGVPAAGI